MTAPPRPVADASTWDTDLETVLHDQCALVAELKPLAERQGTLIAAGDTAELLELLGRRQAIVDRFGGTEQRLDPLTTGLSERLSTLPDARRRALADLIDRVDEGLKAVAAIDARDHALLAEARGAIATELGKIGTAAAAHRAYRGAPGGPRFADRRG